MSLGAPKRFSTDPTLNKSTMQAQTPATRRAAKDSGTGPLGALRHWRALSRRQDQPQEPQESVAHVPLPYVVLVIVCSLAVSVYIAGLMFAT